MTVYCPSMSSAIVLSTGSGLSKAARVTSSAEEEALRHYLAPRAESLVSEIEEILIESGITAARTDEWTPINRATANAAMAFTLLLPRSLPPPEIAPEADGEISFDWLGPSGKMFSVSVNGHGRLAYAGSFGWRSKVHGTEQLSDSCPPEIIVGISKTYS